VGKGWCARPACHPITDLGCALSTFSSTVISSVVFCVFNATKRKSLLRFLSNHGQFGPPWSRPSPYWL
jgi:hypothetical protein